MSRRDTIGVRTFGAAVAATCLFLAPAPAAAQTTVVLDAPDTEVTDAFVRGGTYARTVYNTDGLVTKANSNMANVRRALLKFDTQTRVPMGATIQSAKLVLTLKRTDPQTRTLGVYRVTKSFEERDATWYRRKSIYSWTSAGGDLSARLASVTVGTTVGSKVTIDLTSLVQATVKGSYGSRYTRIALVDTGSSSDASYKEFYSSESSDSRVRPTLTVVYGAATKPTTTTPTTGSGSNSGSSSGSGSNSGSSSGSDSNSGSSSGTRLKVLNWNTQYGGMGTDGVFNPDRVINFIVKVNPDVISLNEITRYWRYDPRRDLSKYYAQQLTAKTGRTWYHYYRTDNGAAAGVGNMVLSRFPIASTSYCQLSARRVAVHAAIYVNGRLLNVWSTHLDSSDGSSMRIAEVRTLNSCLSSFAQQRIVAGDFNAGSTTTEINTMETAYYDGWAEAASDRTAVSFPGNTSFGATRNGRIDYVWYSKGAGALVLKAAAVLDSRDARGYRPSDHKPLLATFEVR